MTIILTAFWLVLQAISPDSTTCTPEKIAPDNPFLSFSTDGGLNWVHFNTATPMVKRPSGIWGDDAQVIVATNEEIFRINPVGPLHAFEPVAAPGVPISRIYTRGEEMFIISNWNGLYRRDPLTRLWIPVTKNLPDKFFTSVYQHRDGTIYACGEFGLYRSSDKGQTWTQALHHGHVREIAEQRGVLFGYGMHGIWISVDNGLTWDNQFNPGGQVVHLHSTGERVYVIMEGIQLGGIPSANTIWQSDDQGESWHRADINLPKELFSIHRLAYDKGHLIAASGKGIYVSEDAGKTWQQAQKPVENGGGFYELVQSNGTFYSLYLIGC